MNDKKDSKKNLEQPVDIFTITYEEADSIGAEYITLSELEAMGFGIGDEKEEEQKEEDEDE